jgi:4-hydroxy-2-oxoheptanedioate aldolase
MFAVVIAAGAGVLATVQGQTRQRVNPVIALVEQGKPVFGLYAPSPPRAGGRRGRGAAAETPPAPPAATVTPMDLAGQALAYEQADFIFSGGMEGSVERGLPAFLEFAAAMRDAGVAKTSPFLHLSHPMIVKTEEIMPGTEPIAPPEGRGRGRSGAAALPPAPRQPPDPAMAPGNIARQLNAGVSGVMLVDVKSAEEARIGVSAMRFVSKGGTRPDGDVGIAPSVWGLSEAAYRERADLWPLEPAGELINWTIIESKEGLAHVREIAAVPGVGVLWPGAGTLRGVFTTTNAAGERVQDTVAWEAAIQQVLAACKEFKVACGYPANENDIELRMQQGFSVFVMNWGDAGFRTVLAGRKAGGR